jgi:hypothetical protein
MEYTAFFLANDLLQKDSPTRDAWLVGMQCVAVFVSG